MERGQLYRHFVLEPHEQTTAVEALRLEGYVQTADALEAVRNKEIQHSVMTLIMGGVGRLAEMGRLDALRLQEAYDQLS